MGKITPVLSSHSEMLIRESAHRKNRATLHLVAIDMRHPTREELIREAAFHRAEARGFAAGHELEDWLMAEADVNERMSGEGRAY